MNRDVNLFTPAMDLIIRMRKIIEALLVRIGDLCGIVQRFSGALKAVEIQQSMFCRIFPIMWSKLDINAARWNFNIAVIFHFVDWNIPHHTIANKAGKSMNAQGMPRTVSGIPDPIEAFH